MPAKPAEKTHDVDDQARFDVDLARPVRVGRTAWARPGQRVEMKGRLVKEHAEHVADIRSIAD